jgi:Family of unknown function (DUF5675)
MKIDVLRFISDKETTISRILLDGVFICFGLEDTYRDKKIKHETRIPAGKYKIKLRKQGTHHEKYKIRFEDIHRGMLHLQNVPNFEYILIHCGNTHADTSGCLLVGMAANTESGNMSISSSTVAYRKLYPLVVDAAANNRLEIEFFDNDR